MTHEELQNLVPLMALDALSPSEEMAVRAHLTTCRDCSELLREHLETAGDLALLAVPAAPPPGLKDRIMAATAEPAAEAGAARSLRPAEAAGAARTPEAPVAGARRPAPFLHWRHAIAGLAAACLVLALVNILTARRLAERDAVIARQNEIVALMSEGRPTMTMIATSPAGGATGRVFVEGDRAAVVLTGLRDADGGVYELWGIRGGEPRALFALHPDGNGTVAVLIERGARDLDGAAVSLEPEEPAAGSTQPRGPIHLKTA
jgi:hypothetical protein